jgi:hypothetical protein
MQQIVAPLRGAEQAEPFATTSRSWSRNTAAVGQDSGDGAAASSTSPTCRRPRMRTPFPSMPMVNASPPSVALAPDTIAILLRATIQVLIDRVITRGSG